MVNIHLWVRGWFWEFLWEWDSHCFGATKQTSHIRGYMILYSQKKTLKRSRFLVNCSIVGYTLDLPANGPGPRDAIVTTRMITFLGSGIPNYTFHLPLLKGVDPRCTLQKFFKLIPKMAIFERSPPCARPINFGLSTLVVEPTHLKNILRQIGSFPEGSGWKQKLWMKPSLHFFCESPTCTGSFSH